MPQLPTFTQEQYQTLLAAYATGTLEVEYADKKVKYRSLDEMWILLQQMQAQLDPSSGRSHIQKTRVTGGFFPPR